MLRSILKTLGLIAGLGGALQAAPYSLQAGLDRPVIDAHGDRSVILRLDLQGLRADLHSRPPLNIALVIDRSGSMAGDKLDRAKEAARNIVERLGGNDIFSLVSFDDQVKVELSARKLGDRRAAYNAINGLQPGGSTALYSGVQAAIGQAREEAGHGRLSRVLLLSDGLANVGPDKPSDARQLGREAARHGVTVSTFGLGLGYDEDLLTALSQASDGNHAFIENSRDLARILDHELGDALAVAARDIVIEIHLADGVRFKRCYDRQVDVDGKTLRLKLGDLASGQDKQLLLELQAPEAQAGSAEDLAQVSVQGADAQGQAAPAQRASLQVRYTADAKEADESRDPNVVAAAVQAQANEAREQAVALRDQGKADEASALLKLNASQVRASIQNLPASAPAAAGAASLSKALESEADAVNGSGDDWNAARKDMKAKAYQMRSGQSYQE